LKSLLDCPGNLLEICSVKFVDTLECSQNVLLVVTLGGSTESVKVVWHRSQRVKLLRQMNVQLLLFSCYCTSITIDCNEFCIVCVAFQKQSISIS